MTVAPGSLHDRDLGRFESALLSPAVSPSRKRAVVAKLIDVHAKIRNFLYVVIDHRRVHELPSIVEAFEFLIDEHLGFVRADVLRDGFYNQRNRRPANVRLMVAGKQAKVNFKTDPCWWRSDQYIGSNCPDGDSTGTIGEKRVNHASVLKS